MSPKTEQPDVLLNIRLFALRMFSPHSRGTSGFPRSEVSLGPPWPSSFLIWARLADFFKSLLRCSTMHSIANPPRPNKGMAKVINTSLPMSKLPKAVHDEKSFGIPPPWIFLLGRVLKESIAQRRARCLLELFARLHRLRITQRMNPRPITRTRRTPALPFRERPEDIRPADVNAVLTPFPIHTPPLQTHCRISFCCQHREMFPPELFATPNSSDRRLPSTFRQGTPAPRLP